MIRVSPEDEKAVKVEVEVWQVPYEGLAKVLEQEPEGLSIGKVALENGEIVLGVIGEPELVKGMKEISQYGGWKNYITLTMKQHEGNKTGESDDYKNQ